MRKTFVVVLFLVLPAQLVPSTVSAQEVRRDLVTSHIFAGNMKAVSQVEQETRQELEDLGALGPAVPAKDLSKVNVLQLEYFSGLDLEDLCRFSLTVYPDANEDSNIYYYRPHRYVLKFDPDEGGYFLHLEYAHGEAGGRNVLMQARLTPGGDRGDLDVLEALLITKLREEGDSDPHPRLMPLPATPEVEFNLSNWNIEEVIINGIDVDTGEIQLTLSADVPTKELVSSTINNNMGLTGYVRLRPFILSDSQRVPEVFNAVAEIRLADIAGGPPMRFRASGSTIRVENQWPFAMELKHLVYLVRDQNGGLKLRGWNLMEDELLLPNDVATMKLRDLNDEVRSNDVIVPMFIANLDQDIEIGRSVIDSVTSGVGALSEMQLMIDVVRPDSLYEQYDIYKLAVAIRSAHFGAGRR
ncbi:MAG: hypothetical protein GY906_14395, partial [bacterium]|nr:hypothetical protein [bacterium]